jgi:hypothetical protein
MKRNTYADQERPLLTIFCYRLRAFAQLSGKNPIPNRGVGQGLRHNLMI